MIQLTILGNNSALPAHGRWPTAQMIAIKDKHFLVDCGEGTQMRMQALHIGWSKLHHIFISHLHGDHFYGLIGLLTSMNLLGRTQPLHIYAPPELEPILSIQWRIGGASLQYELHFHPLEQTVEEVILLDDNHVRISAFPVQHRIPCYGFKFISKSMGRKILPEACEAYQIPTSAYASLKNGEDYIDAHNNIIKNELLSTPGPKAASYAYCADTLYTESILPYIQGCHTIYHETTFLKADANKAASRFHSTTHDAANIAKLAQVTQLLIGHYSSRYLTTEVFEQEAREIFAPTIATETGAVYTIKYQKEC